MAIFFLLALQNGIFVIPRSEFFVFYSEDLFWAFFLAIIFNSKIGIMVIYLQHIVWRVKDKKYNIRNDNGIICPAMGHK